MTKRLAAALVGATALITACTAGDQEAVITARESTTTQSSVARATETPANGTPATATATWIEGEAVTPEVAGAATDVPAPASPGTVAPASASLVNLQTRSIDLALVTEVDDALAMAVRPGAGTVHIGRQTGEIHRIDRDGRSWVTQPTPMFSLGDRTIADKERGLLGFTFSPDGELLYVVWTDRDTNSNVLSEYSINADGDADLGSERIVMTVAQPFKNHNGGNVSFGPDGYLYYGLGDGGAGGDPLNSGQDTGTLLGAILRIDPTDQSTGAYGIPPSNPFVDGGGRAEIFLSGARNPWRFSFDPATGDLWVADVGQDEFEEINVLRATEGGGAGANLGWNLREGFADFEGGGTPASGELTDPLFAYPHSDGACSITGGFVYRGEDLPQIEGAYIYGDWCNGQIWALSQDGQVNQLLDIRVGPRSLTSFGEDPDGEIWVLTDGPIFALVPER